MGGELVENQQDHPKKSLKEQFEDHFSYYLLCGMTAEQYWDGDCTLVIYYRRKDRMEQDRRNEEMWLQGLYIYETLCRVAPILNGFVKNPKAEPYMDKPYPRTKEALESEKAEQGSKDRQQAKLMSWAERVNKAMRKKNGQKC